MRLLFGPDGGPDAGGCRDEPAHLFQVQAPAALWAAGALSAPGFDPFFGVPAKLWVYFADINYNRCSGGRLADFEYTGRECVSWGVGQTLYADL